MTGFRKSPPPAIATALAEGGGPRLWRSLEALADRPDIRRWIEDEFPHVAEAGRTDRRTVMKLMGASLALAGLTGCGEPPPSDAIVSRARGEPGAEPGQPLLFASSLPLEGYGRGVLVVSQSGRPVKVEGNPLHPASLGATDAFAQAAILSLYDPDRSDAWIREGHAQPAERLEPALAALAGELAARRGRGLRIVTGPTSSPSLVALLEGLTRRLPEARWIAWSPVDDDNARRGAELAFGRPVEVQYDLARARTIVSLDADLLGPGPRQVMDAAAYAAGRREGGQAGRLWAFEPELTLTGARADMRLPLRPSEVAAVAGALAAGLGLSGAPAGLSLPAGLLEDLAEAGPHALVAAGRRQPPEVHALAHALNQALGAAGTTVRYTEPVRPGGPSGPGALAELAREIEAGAVSHLVVIDANPAYDAPADIGLAGLIPLVPFSLHVGPYLDETGSRCRWHVPLSHPLESWGDLRAPDGTVGLMQPVLAARPGRLTAQEAVAALAGRPASAQDLVREHWRAARSEAEFEPFWRRALHDGVMPGTALPALDVRVPAGWAPPALPEAAAGVEVAFAPDPSVWDGRFANNAWLQELPKPLTKLVWDNAALLGPETAGGLGIGNGDVIAVEVAGRALEAPAWVLPGHAPGCVTLPLGYGRTRSGGIGDGCGFSAYAVRPSSGRWIAGAAIRPTGRRVALVTTQDHGSMAGRDIVLSVPPGGALEREPGGKPSFYPEYRYEGPAWGMVVDLDACIGCNACVVACQAENNVPVVGREEVGRGREMHWLRIDRYWEGDPDDPATHFQPMLCMHCEKAPCEVVCPVNATVHDSEGLNLMVYNRCVGTRYCSNNCPYKVRRFNWFDYAGARGGRPDETVNPDVSVRVRGVMEKCTYCVQRIQAARTQAKLEGRPIRDGEVMTACQQACPTRVFTFGDLNDPGSAVSRAKSSPREYALLEELNTQPRTTYLASVRNPVREGGA